MSYDTYIAARRWAVTPWALAWTRYQLYSRGFMSRIDKGRAFVDFEAAEITRRALEHD